MSLSRIKNIQAQRLQAEADKAAQQGPPSWGIYRGEGLIQLPGSATPLPATRVSTNGARAGQVVAVDVTPAGIRYDTGNHREYPITPPRVVTKPFALPVLYRLYVADELDMVESIQIWIGNIRVPILLATYPTFRTTRADLDQNATGTECEITGPTARAGIVVGGGGSDSVDVFYPLPYTISYRLEIQCITSNPEGVSGNAASISFNTPDILQSFGISNRDPAETAFFSLFASGNRTGEFDDGFPLQSRSGNDDTPNAGEVTTDITEFDNRQGHAVPLYFAHDSQRYYVGIETLNTAGTALEERYYTIDNGVITEDEFAYAPIDSCGAEALESFTKNFSKRRIYSIEDLADLDDAIGGASTITVAITSQAAVPSGLACELGASRILDVPVRPLPANVAVLAIAPYKR